MNGQNTQTMKIKKIIIKLFIIMILLSSALIIILNNPIDKELRYIYSEKNNGDIKIMPTNVVSLFSEYRGKISQRSIYKSIYSFVTKTVEKYYIETKNLDDEMIKEYYSKNSKSIEKEIGISEESEFIKLAENLKNLKVEELKLEEYTIHPNTVKNKNGYIECVLLVKYEKNEQIGFYLNVQNKINESKTPIVYKACVEEDILEYQYIKPEYNEMEYDNITVQDGIAL